MSHYVVTYDLTIPGQNYQALFLALRQLGASRALYSVWSLRSTDSAEHLRNHLRQFIDVNDRLLVTRVSDWASFNAMANLNAA